MLTVEHLRYAGDQTLSLIVDLINRIIEDVNQLSSSNLNTSIATIVYKGKGKNPYHHKSYRLVRVSPLITRIFDEHVRPYFLQSTRHKSNPNQYGYTSGVNYLLGALVRHESEMFCLDMKKTIFVCTLDGVSAFDVVSRAIQTRELYCEAEERGEFWRSTHFEYKNTKTRIKLNGKLSDELTETLGCKQGSLKSGDHYKFYVAPTLETLDKSELGLWIGPINVVVSCVADDILIMSDDQNKMQCLLDLAASCGKMYRIEYGASKTNITISGSETDRNYFKEVSPWQMNGDTVKVADDNEHLGLIISGSKQVEKNIDMKIQKARKSLFSLLGTGFAYKCTLSPSLKLYLYRTYTSPILRSGLSAMTIRNSQMEPLAIFQRKVLKSCLRLRKCAATPAIHFLTGELPIEGLLHQDVFSLFYNILSNPATKIFQITKYLLENSNDNSRTWSIHVRHLCSTYGIKDPLVLMKNPVPGKETFMEEVKTKISAFHECQLRQQALENSVMKFFNVSLIGLRGRLHYCLLDVDDSRKVALISPHVQMMIGNYFTGYLSSKGPTQECPLCDTLVTSYIDSLTHLIATCVALNAERNRVLEEYTTLCKNINSPIVFNDFQESKMKLAQFILDPASLNLNRRVNISDPNLHKFLKISRNFCFLINKRRREILTVKK